MKTKCILKIIFSVYLLVALKVTCDYVTPKIHFLRKSIYPHCKRECQYIFQYLNKLERRRGNSRLPHLELNRLQMLESLWVTRDGFDQLGVLKLGMPDHTLMFIPHLSLFNTDGRHKIEEL